MKDIRIDKNDCCFKFRVCGVIEQNGKYLVDCCDDNGFFCFPGGHVEINEKAENAVVREVLEETKIECSIKKILAVIELFYNKKNRDFHELGFYYLLKPKTKILAQDFCLEENDNGYFRKHNFKWFTAEELLKNDVRPTHISKIISEGKEKEFISENAR